MDTVYIGSLNSAQVRVGELFREAISSNSAALTLALARPGDRDGLRDRDSASVVARNHPSGDPTPSPEDVAVTRQIVEAGKLLSIDAEGGSPGDRPVALGEFEGEGAGVLNT